MSGRAFLSAFYGKHEEAQELMYGAYLKDPHSIFNLLTVASVSVRVGQEEVANEALAAMLQQIKHSEDELNLMYRMFDDFPFLNTEYRNGQSVLDVIRDAERILERRAVELVPKVGFPLNDLIDIEGSRWRFPFGSCSIEMPDSRLPTVAIIGSGLLIEHPCLENRIDDSFDFTATDPWDRNGATTAQALQLDDHKLLNIKVLDQSGHGSVESLIKGFARVIVSDAELVMTHIQTDVEDSHLVGLVRRASARALIVATEPAPGSGSVFPGSIRDVLLVVS